MITRVVHCSQGAPVYTGLVGRHNANGVPVRPAGPPPRRSWARPNLPSQELLSTESLTPELRGRILSVATSTIPWAACKTREVARNEVRRD